MAYQCFDHQDIGWKLLCTLISAYLLLFPYHVCYCCRPDIKISIFECFSEILNFFNFHPKWNGKKYVFVINLLNLFFYTDSCYFLENQSDFSYIVRSGGPHNWMSKSVLYLCWYCSVGICICQCFLNSFVLCHNMSQRSVRWYSNGFYPLNIYLA